MKLCSELPENAGPVEVIGKAVGRIMNGLDSRRELLPGVPEHHCFAQSVAFCCNLRFRHDLFINSRHWQPLLRLLGQAK